MAPHDQDFPLVEACQRLDATEDERRALYERFKRSVYNICYRYTGNEADALDAAQETFRAVFRRIGTFRQRARFASWIYRIAINCSFDVRRERSRRRLASLDAARDAAPVGSPIEPLHHDLPVLHATRRELGAAIQAAVDRLPPRMRDVVVLRYFEGLSYGEVAEVLSLSLGTVKSRLSRAHERLATLLAPDMKSHEGESRLNSCT